ncbi:polynucleotide 3'-phosphatase ZDP isoform X1 [Cucurbita maxima]|uniref:Polynucleotide 3'-phosphatase ZDP isoform X1 n=1 Tax=Cucurbita maxima TaxID=3661 RepID=A0A6J1IH48_CUCMA|nr:polynucleotide 3'-phosphatase ZDP isoform X1 [Cucurbita maxima]
MTYCNNHILSSLLQIPNSPLSHFSRFSSHSRRIFFQGPTMSTSAVKIVAEYAKSNRSTCKNCSKTIPAKALRLGFVSRDGRGFDMTRWFHSDCASFGSDPVSSAEQINGFALLKGDDQEALKKLVSRSHESKVRKRDEDEEDGIEERDQKKVELSASSLLPKLDLVLSASNIKTKYKDATLLPKWKAFQTLIFLEQDDGLHHSSKIAAFDFDGCLANTSVKRVGAEAWSLMYPSIPQKLQSLYNEGYKLVIFTNESNIERWKNKRQVAVDSKLGRLDSFISRVNVPVQVFVACGIGSGSGKSEEDPFRKPKPGMWQIMENHFNGGIPINLDQCFYVGDAAGRGKDHSDADLRFAQAIGLKFYVPEEIFVEE